MTVSAVRCSDSVIHSLVPMAPERRVLLVSWYSYACLPVSASARNGFDVPFSLLMRVGEAGGRPELPLGLDRLQARAALVEELGDHDEPRQQRHDQQNDENRSANDIAIRDQGTKAIWVINSCLLH